MSIERVHLHEEILFAILDLAYEVLGTRCDPQRNFFEYGDSLAATQLCHLAADRYGWIMSARDIFGWESFSLLAGAVERDEAGRRAQEQKGET
ncbi:acyl carrier protein [Streptomyces rubiginosohelvolus]|uniref:acyl carrier protein n=1 Tax=Streptomyces TaxID=1883 RepID=UPI001CD384A1|nr:acyl carrier protein [Streptomyces sp. 7G]MCA1268683.1 acyl carrier protein [Streptomyces sp. 7G]